MPSGSPGSHLISCPTSARLTRALEVAVGLADGGGDVDAPEGDEEGGKAVFRDRLTTELVAEDRAAQADQAEAQHRQHREDGNRESEIAARHGEADGRIGRVPRLARVARAPLGLVLARVERP
eukprot:4721592-Pleurochrysis_carterae.AAC.2